MEFAPVNNASSSSSHHMNQSMCPCSSGLLYAACCQPKHQGMPAATPEALMRSRYSAFVLNFPDYLLNTWHPSTRPTQLDLHHQPTWKSLQVLQASEQNDKGQVHFRALYQTNNQWGFLEELSDFVREHGIWFYLHGDTSEGQLKPGRNDKCPCGSGRKFKVCCG